LFARLRWIAGCNSGSAMRTRTPKGTRQKPLALRPRSLYRLAVTFPSFTPIRRDPTDLPPPTEDEPDDVTSRR
jgi:hypothetical protein